MTLASTGANSSLRHKWFISVPQLHALFTDHPLSYLPNPLNANQSFLTSIPTDKIGLKSLILCAHSHLSLAPGFMDLKTHGYFLSSLALRVFPPRPQTQLLPLAQAHFLSMSPPWLSWFIDSSSMISRFLSPKPEDQTQGLLISTKLGSGPLAAGIISA